MKQLKLWMIIGVIFVLAAGSLSHFVYDWSAGNPVVGLFTPVNESVWEHMKLLFFPMLLYSIAASVRLKNDSPCIAVSLCFGILIGTFLIPAFYYTYTAVLNRNFFPLDIAVFLLSTIIAFYAAYRLSLSCKLQPYAALLYGLIGILFLCFMLFTYRPPMPELFADPTVSCLQGGIHPVSIFTAFSASATVSPI